MFEPPECVGAGVGGGAVGGVPGQGGKMLGMVVGNGGRTLGNGGRVDGNTNGGVYPPPPSPAGAGPGPGRFDGVGRGPGPGDGPGTVGESVGTGAPVSVGATGDDSVLVAGVVAVGVPPPRGCGVVSFDESDSVPVAMSIPTTPAPSSSESATSAMTGARLRRSCS